VSSNHFQGLSLSSSRIEGFTAEFARTIETPPPPCIRKNFSPEGDRQVFKSRPEREKENLFGISCNARIESKRDKKWVIDWFGAIALHHRPDGNFYHRVARGECLSHNSFGKSASI
jgi:hypothetical protein